MKTTFILLVIFHSFTALADPSEVLLKRDATAEDYALAVLDIKASGEAPLTTPQAIAELCYDIDLCAQGEKNDSNFKSCEEFTFPDGQEEFDVLQSGFCPVWKFRKEHSCNKDVDPLTVNAQMKMSSMLNDLSNVYTNVITTPIVKLLSGETQQDFCSSDGNQMAQEYLDKHPEKMKELQRIFNDAKALGQYTLNCYSKMNPILFKKDITKMRRYFNLYAATIKSLKVAPEFKDKVNRGVSLPQKVLNEHLKIGNVVCYSGFTSTAIHHESDYGDKPRNNFLEDKCSQRLYINPGESGVRPGRLIDSLSAAKGENEVLFSPGACFRIDSVSPRTDSSGMDSDQTCEENQRVNIEMTQVK